MPSKTLASLKPHRQHRVDPSIQVGLHGTAENTILYAGPPSLEQFAGNVIQCWPLGLIQGFSMSAAQAVSQLFEIGSARSYFYAGKTAYQAGFQQLYYHGVNLLRQLYASYTVVTTDGNSMVANIIDQSMSDIFGTSYYLHKYGISSGTDELAGSGAFFQSLHAKLFSQPIGLGYIMYDNDENILGHYYMENAMIPGYNFGMDANGMLFQESVSVRFERLMPVDVILDSSSQNFLNIIRKKVSEV